MKIKSDVFFFFLLKSYVFIEVLFDLFDLNELESLAAIDIEFMMYSCISATYKIFSMNSEIDSEDIANFVYKHINPENRLTVTTLLQFIFVFFLYKFILH